MLGQGGRNRESKPIRANEKETFSERERRKKVRVHLRSFAVRKIPRLARRSVFLGGFLGALLGEEFAQDGGTLFLTDTGGDGAVVVEAVVL